MGKKQPLVSVVMSSYNHSEFVGKAIESVLNQTYTNFEFIIADDGSTDNSVEVINNYQDQRIHFKAFEKNTALAASEYTYEQVKGKYIACICSDDMWKEDLLEKYVTFLENNEEYGCCFCKPLVINENDEVELDSANSIFGEPNREREKWFERLYIGGNCLCAPAACIRKSVFDKVGRFRFQYRQLQDYEYWLRLLQVANIYIYPEELMMYRMHSTGDNHNISKPTLETNIRDRIEREYILLDIMEQLEESFFNKAFKDKLIYAPGTEQYNLDCEKFGAIMVSSAAPPQVAIFFYYKHYNDEKFRYHLEHYYGVPRKEFWKMAGTDYDHISEYVENIHKLMDTVKNLQQIVMQQNEQINQLKADSGLE